MSATVNIGLAIPTGGFLSPAHALGMLYALGGERPTRWTVKPSATEPTLVAELPRPLTHAAAFEVAAALHQDAIAQFDGRDGDLIGPRAAAWGQFDPSQFLTIQ